MDSLPEFASNALSPICRLPPELLATIFVHCALDHYKRRYIDYRVPSWVNVSYVCRYWRDAALACPTLWTYHFVVSLRWTQELLARSRQAPLKICLRFDHGYLRSWSSSVVEMLMTHAEYIEELRLYLLGQISHQILEMLSAPAPRLQHLQIISGGFLSKPSIIPFHGETPALRTIDLNDCPVSWYSLKISSLTTLVLDHLPSEFQRNTAEFLVTLSCMQELTGLYLRGSVGSATFLSGAEFRTFKKISLPHLVRLLIHAPLSTVITLLSCIDIPLKALVRIECYYEGTSTPSDYSLLSSVLAPRLAVPANQIPPRPTIQSLCIHGVREEVATLFFSSRERDCDFNVTMLRDMNRDCNMNWNCDNPLEVSIYWKQTIMVEDDIIRDICCSIPLANVQTLHVMYPPFSSSFWRKLLGHLQNLRCIKVSQGNMPDLASVLSVSRPAHEEGENQTQDHILVPDLAELELTLITFPRRDAGTSATPTVTREALFEALSTRNFPRDRLTMSQCIIGRSGGWDVSQMWGSLSNIHNPIQGGSHPNFQVPSEGDSGDSFEDESDSESDSEIYWEGGWDNEPENDSEDEDELEDEQENQPEDELEDHSEDAFGSESEDEPENDSGEEEEALESEPEDEVENSSEEEVWESGPEDGLENDSEEVWESGPEDGLENDSEEALESEPEDEPENSSEEYDDTGEDEAEADSAGDSGTDWEPDGDSWDESD